MAVKDGRIFAAGAPHLMMTEDTIQEVFDLECRVVADPVAGTPMCVPIGRKREKKLQTKSSDLQSELKNS